jgi:hypothetical protein
VSQPDQDEPSEQDELKRGFETARRLLLSDVADANQRLVNGLGDHSAPWNWDEYSPIGQVENRRLFEECQQDWLESVKASITRRFDEMHSIYSKLKGTLPSEAADRTAEIIGSVLSEHCDFEKLLASIPVFMVTGDLFLPPGVTEDMGLLSGTTQQVLEAHLNWVAEESFLRHFVPTHLIPAASLGAAGKVISSSEAERPNNRFERSGKVWSIVYGDESCHLPDQLGLEYIARLLENAGRPIAVTALVAGSLAQSAPSSNEEPNQAPTISDGGLHQRRADDQAMREYKDRIDYLNSEVAGAESRNDLGTVERLKDERDQIVSHLKLELGMSGRARNFSDSVEKARNSARQAIDRAISSIGSYCPTTAEHLRRYIEKGMTPIYLDTASRWKVSRK